LDIDQERERRFCTRVLVTVDGKLRH
jgi:hypothetical protein